ncbi:MAG: protein kinase domain-containing protein, partial [Persicimonas sp.]
MTSERDIRLAQLALARGLVDLPSLLTCVREAGSKKVDLTERLTDKNLLDSVDLEQLLTDVEESDPEALRAEYEQGDTIALDAISNTGTSSPPSLPPGPPKTDPGDNARADTTDLRISSSDQVDRSSLLEGDDPLDYRYEFGGELGRGGMGQVFLARDQLLERDIALKTLRPDARSEEARRHLLQEARVTGMLEHSSIIPIYDLGTLTDEEPFYTMRVVREQSLAQLLDQMKRQESPGADYSLTQMVSILRQVCLAVHYAHDSGIIHRDLKPENILVGNYGEVFVIDWGVAKSIDEQHSDDEAHEEHGTLVGTPQYMAPEQALGHTGQLGVGTDVYALGAVLYEVLTLQPLFEADHVMALLLKVANDPVTPPTKRAPQREIPQELEEICMRALAKEPAQRFGSADEMARELELFLEGVKERERRKEMARQATAEANRARKRYEDARERYLDAMQQVSHAKLNAPPPGRQDEDQKREIWRMQERVESLQIEVERHFGSATRLYGQALGHLPEAAAARRALADLYWQRFREAEAAGDRARATYFEGLVRQYNDGRYDDLLEGKAFVTIETESSGANAELFAFVEQDRRLVERHTAHLGRLPILKAEVDHGSYVIELDRPGYVDLKVPVLLDRMEHQEHELKLFETSTIPDDCVVISGGDYLSGEIQHHKLEEHRKFVPTFAIMKYPVTCGEYIEFLNALTSSDPEQARRHAPRIEDNQSYFPIDEEGRYQLPRPDADGDYWEPSWPICMVSYHDALAYAQWRSQRDGVEY